MQRRYNLAHLILAGVVVLGLTPLMVDVDAQAQIAFMSERDGSAEIYVMDADGGNQQNLTNNPRDDYTPSWSPDGKRIAFVSERDGHVIDGWPTNEIYVMDADGGNQQNLTNNPHYDMSPSWSPDGKRIVFQSDREEPLRDVDIYVMDADGGNQQKLTNNPNSDWHPSWSPDGKRIVFSARRDGKFEIAITNEIYVMDADGGNPQNLTNHASSDASPAWLNSPFSVSPAGKKFTMWGQLKQVNQ